jgi:hypothetical protein
MLETLQTFPIQDKRFLGAIFHVVFYVLQVRFSPMEHPDRVVAGVQVLQDLRHDLTLGATVFFTHCSGTG